MKRKTLQDGFSPFLVIMFHKTRLLFLGVALHHVLVTFKDITWHPLGIDASFSSSDRHSCSMLVLGILLKMSIHNSDVILIVSGL